MGPVAAVAFGGFGAVAVTGIWTMLFPPLRRVDRLTGSE
jgi:hypothetical protein